MSEAFTFAGFRFPRAIAQLPRGTFAARIQRMRKPLTGPYMHAPKPEQAGKGAFFYLASDFQPGLRWQYVDEEFPRLFDHRGWYTSELQDETVRGITLRLPKGRGFLAGWTMGEGMASECETDIYATQRDAAIAADSLAESVAEREREYQERWQAARDLEDSIAEKLQRLRECLALRHKECLSYVRQEIEELIGAIREARESLATQYADVRE